MNEVDVFSIQNERELYPVGWIHVHLYLCSLLNVLICLGFAIMSCMRALQTHPSQGCFMSSVDLHTHYSYQVVMCCFFMGLRRFSSQFLSCPFQVMVPEAFAIVVAPTDSSRYVFPNPS